MTTATSTQRVGPLVARLQDGRRLHLQHGPMDLVVDVDASLDVRDAAERAGIERFATILEELVGELAFLRRPVPAGDDATGAVARRMVAATRPFGDVFLTPMIAVAGSVADEVRATIAAHDEVARVTVNNGGDLSMHLGPGASVVVGLVADIGDPTIVDRLRVAHDEPVRGVATSGRRGRSNSLGIADAVTVLADRAAVADAAATLVANAVDVDHPAVRRIPACELDPDSDLGERLVTTDVGDLPPAAVAAALDAGEAEARRLRDRCPDLHGLVMTLRGQRRLVGPAVAGLDMEVPHVEVPGADAAPTDLTAAPTRTREVADAR